MVEPDKLLDGIVRGDISPETALVGVVMTAVEAERTTKECEDCGGLFNSNDGRFYKYEPSVWLCDDCHDERMEE